VTELITVWSVHLAVTLVALLKPLDGTGWHSTEILTRPKVTLYYRQQFWSLMITNLGVSEIHIKICNLNCTQSTANSRTVTKESLPNSTIAELT